jgi:hypothetical protein
MKFHTTRKAMRERGTPIISVSYCGAQTLLRFKNPIAYNAGIYGWNCDYYTIDGVIICTGYRPHGYSTTKSNAIIDAFEKRAQAIANDNTLTYDQCKGYTNSLLDMCIEQILTEVK